MDCYVPERVEEIIDNEKGEWNLEAIENWLTEEEKQAIEVIPISEQEREDNLIWPYNSSGIYTVKFGYEVLKQDKMIKVSNASNVTSSSHIVDRKIWNTIWSMKIPNKVKNFLWKCYVDAIPCCYELWKKKVRKNPYCLVCGEGNEQ